MMNMMDDEKKKSATLIIGIGEKESGDCCDKVFSALKAGDKQGFKKALRMMVKEMIFEMQYPEEKEDFSEEE